jgi:hypothetical protein
MWDDPITYTVEGRGEFPLDMLRRDQAWPADTRSALAIGERGRRRVTLTAAVARHVAVARWASFGWRVEDADLFPYAQAGVLARAA